MGQAMTLICIGGAEDKEGDLTVLKAVLSKAKGAQSRVCVITTATGYPEETKETYIKVFEKLGIACEVMHIDTPAAANDSATVKKIENADVIFFSGGDQSRLTAALDGTASLAAVRSRHEAGAVVAGTSAGAAAMSALMVTGGQPEDAHLPGAITSGKGLSLVDDIIFDTHFLNRGRLPRLFNLISAHPAKTGIGLDEDTAVVMHGIGILEVIGSGAVTIVQKNVGVQGGEGVAEKDFKVTTLRSGNTHKLR